MSAVPLHSGEKNRALSRREAFGTAFRQKHLPSFRNVEGHMRGRAKLESNFGRRKNGSLRGFQDGRPGLSVARMCVTLVGLEAKVLRSS